MREKLVRPGSARAAPSAAAPAQRHGGASLAAYAWAAVALAAAFLVLFGLVERLQVPLLTDPSPWLAPGGLLAASVGTGLLVADVLLPVPSSLVMTAHGALFGVLPGAALSVLGGLGAAMLGFALGRRGGALLARVASPEAQARADALLARYGPFAIVVSRPIPIVAETVAVMAGASRSLPGDVVALSAAAGLAPIALVYAMTGAWAAGFANMALATVLVVLVSGVFWWLGKRLDRRRADDAP